jgi:hypothetical protein
MKNKHWFITSWALICGFDVALWLVAGLRLLSTTYCVLIAVVVCYLVRIVIKELHDRGLSGRSLKLAITPGIVLVIIAVVAPFAGPRVFDGFTPVETLAFRYHEASKYKYRIGAICNDGWRSGATGRGACSHHGGVREWIYATGYAKSWDESKEEADETSWIK